MSDEERIAKLQKLLDRVLTRGEPEEPAESSQGLNGEHPQISEGPSDDPPAASAEAPALERSADPSVHKAAESKEPEPAAPPALESRSRLVSAQADAEELSDDDLVPASESSDHLETAVPLVRRSKRPADEPPKQAEAEPLSEGRIPVGLADVQLAADDEKSLAEEIAAEEVHSSEIE